MSLGPRLTETSEPAATLRLIVSLTVTETGIEVVQGDVEHVTAPAETEERDAKPATAKMAVIPNAVIFLVFFRILFP